MVLPGSTCCSVEPRELRREGGSDKEGGKKGGIERDRGRLQEGRGEKAATASPNQFLRDSGRENANVSQLNFLYLFYNQIVVTAIRVM